MPIRGSNIGLSIGSRVTILRLDPYQATHLIVEIEGLLVGGFAQVSGLQVQIEGHEYRAGGVNDFVYRFAGRTTHPPLLLKQGMSPIDGLWSWHQETVNGRIKRRNGTVYLLDQQRLPVMWWDLHDALPMKWTGPELSADRSVVAFESLEIVHHGLSRPRLATASAGIAAELAAGVGLSGSFF
jgi:phage tail-like protein